MTDREPYPSGPARNHSRENGTRIGDIKIQWIHRNVLTS